VLQLRLARSTNAHPKPVISEDIEFFDVINRFSAHHGMRAARVVPDHSAEGTVLVSCRIRSEGEVVALSGIIEVTG
jgi:hypothetical protein